MHSSMPSVCTIHDLIPLRVPAECGLAKQLYYRLVVRPAAHRAVPVLTVSTHVQWNADERGGLRVPRSCAGAFRLHRMRPYATKIRQLHAEIDKASNPRRERNDIANGSYAGDLTQSAPH